MAVSECVPRGESTVAVLISTGSHTGTANVLEPITAELADYTVYQVPIVSRRLVITAGQYS